MDCPLIEEVPLYFNRNRRLSISGHRQVNVGKCSGGKLRRFFVCLFFKSVSSILIVKYEVKLSAESEGVGIKDDEKNLSKQIVGYIRIGVLLDNFN